MRPVVALRRAHALLRQILADTVNLFVPPARMCHLCGTCLPPPALPFPTFADSVLSVICADCLGRLPWVVPPVCSRCGRPWRHGSVCRFCRRNICLVSGCSAAVYTGAAKELLRELKFRGRRDLAAPLGYVAGSVAAASLPDTLPAAVVPVPLHAARLAERGYNQAELLAVYVGRVLGRPVLPQALLRVKATPPQTSLGLADRLRNVAGAFEVPRPAEISGKRLLLVDDVHTTGATLTSAALALLAAGAADVRFVTAAVAVSPRDIAQAYGRWPERERKAR